MILWFLPARRYISAGTIAMALCLSVFVCPSQVEVFETDERIELVFAVGAFFYLSYTVLKGNSGISENNGTSIQLYLKLWTPKVFARHIDRRNVLST